MLTRIAAVVGCIVALTAAATMQRYGLREGPTVPARFPPPNFGDGAFAHCKIMYRSVRPEANGVGWATDYPYAGINLMIRVSELTKTPVSRDADGNPNYWVVSLSDDALFRCPFTMATDVGTLQFSPAEVRRLRDYLLKGGFLWVDDFWGTAAWDQWSSEIHSVLPEYRITDVPADHPILHMLFQISEIPQITSINFWRRSGGVTSERGADSPHADLRMIADDRGRIMVLMTHNTDVGDSWEREAEDREFFLQFSPNGYALGANVVLYALSH
ncbi:MAG: DUF4159 domain-containing protein [Luteitalea sp.]|nr:DUF4159 domain-containing protein [Luteitalea sp.]